MSVLLSQRVGAQTAVGSRSLWGVCHGDRHGGSTAESLLRNTYTLRLNSRLVQQRCVSSRAYSWQDCSVPTTGCRSFTARAEPNLDDGLDEVDMSSTLRKALANHFPRTTDHQVRVCWTPTCLINVISPKLHGPQYVLCALCMAASPSIPSPLHCCCRRSSQFCLLQ